MNKVTATLSAMLLALAVLVGVGSVTPASAACGSEVRLSTVAKSASDNLRVQGRSIRATMYITKIDCTGYDQVTGMWVVLTKEASGCTSLGGTGWNTDGYRVNPNAIGGTNPPERFVNCTGSGTVFRIDYNVYERITSSMPANQRCVGVHLTIDITLATDENVDSDSICLNGL